MNTKLHARPAVAALRRRLPDAPDGFSLFAHLSEQGAHTGAMYYERSDAPTIIVDRAAVRIETRGPDATLEALSVGGENVLAFATRCLAAFVTSSEPRRLELRFPLPQGDDSEARLLAPSPLDALRAVTLELGKGSDAAADIVCAGVIAYDFIDAFEQLPAAKSDPLNYPDNLFWLAESYVRIDPGAEARAVAMAFGGDDPDKAERAHYDAREILADLTTRCASARLLPLEAVTRRTAAATDPDIDDAAYATSVDVLKERIRAGDVYQIVPSRSFRAPCHDPFAAFARLRVLNPSPAMFFIRGDDHVLFGATPEPAVLVRREDGGFVAEVRPLAGTRPRGATPDEDDKLEADLRLDEKELAEHMMLVDLGRNDIARVSEPATRRVVKLLTVERYSHVMHLVSQVTGKLRSNLDCLHAAVACLNAGTLTGAPKLRAMQILRETEATKRGPYGGSVGWICGDGTLDTAICIRSALVRDCVATVRAGGGVVYDSDPEEEARETSRKAASALAAIADVGAQQ
jgi:anthranilate synthase component 1